ncbi:MAG: PEP-CTERM sorting domain-containing protein [Gemmatimonadaceae bacterium]
MSRYRSLVALAVLSVGAAIPVSAQLVNDGGFDAVGVSAYAYNPSSPFWSFVGGSGLIIGPAALWNVPATAASNQFAFLQANARRDWGIISTTITLPTSGTYSLSFLNSARGAGCCGGNTIFDVLLGSTQIGQFTTSTDDGWTTKGSNFTANAGTYTLAFTTDTKLAGDNTTFIDDVRVDVVATPEPASIALFATGLLSIGGIATRRKRRA